MGDRDLSVCESSLTVACAEATDFKARYTALFDRNSQISNDLNTAQMELASVVGTTTTLEDMLQELKASHSATLQKVRSDQKALDEECDVLRASLRDKGKELSQSKEQCTVMVAEKEIYEKVRFDRLWPSISIWQTPHFYSCLILYYDRLSMI